MQQPGPLFIDLGNGLVQNPGLPQDVFTAALAAQQVAYGQALWQAATDYEAGFISGSAVGLVTAGVLLKQPKSIAVQEWITRLWDIYYDRKPTVTAWTLPSQYDPTQFDFSSAGPMPNSVPELMTEVQMALAGSAS